MTTKNLFKITALTNLHVGSGDQNYGIVDKLVQRDPLTRLPVIHSSGLKGALKVYTKEILKLEKDPVFLNSFGANEDKGLDKYFSGHLLTYPVRSNLKPFFRATCPSVLNEILELSETFGIKPPFAANLETLKNECSHMEKEFLFFDKIEENGMIEEDALNENYEIRENLKNLFTDDLKLLFKCKSEEYVIVRDDKFIEICENLPVIARNRVEEPRNLWYEEVVPRQSEFYFFYIGSDNNKAAIMDEVVKKSNKEMPVQIGANASVGYGFCKFENMS